MIEFLRIWITSVVVTVIFIVLVDMIIPENSLKKYAKLVTGLIVIVTVLTPIFKIFDKGESIQTYISKYSGYYDNKRSDVSKLKMQNEFQNKAMEVFKDNLKKRIEKDIHSITGDYYKISKMEIVEDSKSQDFAEVKYIELRADSKKVQQIDKIVISNNTSNKEGVRNNKIVKLLKDNFGILETSIRFVK